MRGWPLGLAIATCLLTPCQSFAEAQSPAETRLLDRAVGCVETHAAEVERLEGDLLVGAEFLIRYVCSKEVASLATYRASSNWLKSMRAMTASLDNIDEDAETITPAQTKKFQEQQAKSRAAWQATSIDPDTGELIMPKDAPGNMSAAFQTTAMFQTNSSEASAPALRAATARALLRARAERMNPPSAKKN